MKKMIAFALCIVLLIGAMPQAIFSYAAEIPSSTKYVGMETDGENNYYLYERIPAYDSTMTDASGQLHYYAWTPKTSVVNTENSFDAWHSSTGSWKIGTSGSSIEDSKVAVYGGITKYLESLSERISFSARIPEDVQDAIKKDRLLKVESYPTHIRNNKLVDETSFVISMPKHGDKLLSFSVIPKYDLGIDENGRFTYYQFGGTSYIPLIDESRGFNLWAVYREDQKLGQASAYFSYLEDGGSKSGYADFSMISDGGALAPGKKILISDGFTERSYDTDGLRIGSDEGIYLNGGALGYSFRFIMSVRYTYEALEEVFPYIETITVPIVSVQPQDPAAGSDAGNGSEVIPVPVPPEAPQPGEQPLPVEDIYQVRAEIQLPEVSYEGHDVFADDRSEVNINDEYVNLVRAYATGAAKRKLTAQGSSFRETQDYLSHKLRYNNAGNYQVSLQVTAGDASDTDTKNITILRTPSIHAYLGGVQKENRKQTLDVTVAQNPNYPIQQLVIEITDEKSGETIRVNKAFGKAEEKPSNTEHIKYRSLQDLGSSDYQVCTQLAFLSKFTDVREFTYVITARDTRGYEDSVSGTFTVLPDLPPEPAIILQDEYYREMGSNQAKITVSDGSSSDGDQLDRYWEISPSNNGTFVPAASLTGFGDDSFGSLLKVHIPKEGVGPFAVRLRVTDHWVEETLEEYITPADYKQGTAIAVSHVDNIAPEMLLSLKKQKTAEVLILADGKADREKAESLGESLKTILLKKGISAQVRTQRIDQAESDNLGHIQNANTEGYLEGSMLGDDTAKRFSLDLYHSPFWGTRGGFASLEDKVNDTTICINDADTSTVTDGSHVFRMRGTPVIDSSDGTRSYYTLSYPFTLQCFDLYEQGGQKPSLQWTSRITDKVFLTKNNFFTAKMVHDQEQRYLYLVSDDKTLVIDKKTGSFLKTLNFAVGDFNTCANGYIYTIKGDGIYRISESTGGYSRIAALQIEAGYEKAAYYKGKVHFVSVDGSGLRRSIFDPRTEKLSHIALSGSGAQHILNRGRCIAVDPAGQILLYHPTGEFTLYEPSSSKGKTAKINIAQKDKVFLVSAVYDEHGILCYGAAAAKHYNGENTIQTISLADPRKGRFGAYKVTMATQIARENATVFALYDSRLQKVLLEFNAPEKGSRDWARGETIPVEFDTDTLTGSAGDTVFHYDSYTFADRAPGVWLTSAFFNSGVAVRMVSQTMVGRNGAQVQAQAKNSFLSGESNLSGSFLYTFGMSAETMAEIVSEEGANPSAVRFTAEGEDSRLYASFALKPGTTYYYEYDTSSEEDIFNAYAVLNRSVKAEGKSYKAVSIEEEDFYDANIDPFFTLNGKAFVENGHLAVRAESDSSYEMVSSTGGIKFTIPQDKRALLSFDYGKNSSMSFRASIYFGPESDPWQPWNNGLYGQNGNYAGTYFHDQILEPGTYVITANPVSNSTGTVTIDNLKVILIEDCLNPAVQGQNLLDKTSTVQQNVGLNHVSGSFRIPEKALYYEAYSGLVRSTGTPESDHVQVKKGVGTTTATLGITVPAGYQAALARVTTKGIYSSGDTPNYYAYSGLRYPVAYRKLNSYEGYYERGFTLVLSGLEAGVHNIEARRGSRGADVDFASTDLYLVPQNAPSALRNGQVFTEVGKLYFANVTTGSSYTLAFAPKKSGETLLKNLKLYYEEDGSRYEVNELIRAGAAGLASWNTDHGQAAAVPETDPEKLEAESRIYRKGEPIGYSFNYWDFEGDPEKTGFWRYTHEPMNDGLNPISGQLLTAPIESFMIDGKYTVEHWAIDNAGRATGLTDYDKPSNIAEAVFYVIGEPLKENTPPWVESIRTNPQKVTENSTYTLQVRVNDKEKDRLTVKAEIYYENGSRPIYTSVKTGVAANSAGTYPLQTFTGIPAAKEGAYEVIITVSDESGSGIGSHSFVVIAANSLNGMVAHTKAWEENRQTYNFNNFKDRGANYRVNFNTYKAASLPRKRGTNVFWPGEALQLQAVTEGAAETVTAQLSGTGYSVRMKMSSYKEIDGVLTTTFTGELWNKNMASELAKNGPEQRTVIFTSEFENGEILTEEVPIIFDNDDPYWMLHRAY